MPNKLIYTRLPFIDGLSIRGIVEDNGLIWYNLQDACAALKIGNHTKAYHYLDKSDWKRMEYYMDETHHPNMQFTNLSGLFTLVFLATKPSAREFRRWVTGYILPHVLKANSTCSITPIEKWEVPKCRK